MQYAYHAMRVASPVGKNVGRFFVCLVRAKTAKSSSDEPLTAWTQVHLSVGGFSERHNYPMMISVEMQQRLCTGLKKYAFDGLLEL